MLIRFLLCSMSVLRDAFTSNEKQITGVAGGVLKDELVDCLLVVSLIVINTCSSGRKKKKGIHTNLCLFS